jgi:hypothetical protein
MNIFWIIKGVLLFYIVLSPFLNHKDLWFLNHIIFKISILILIIFLSFIDMQLAILLTIALLVMIINTNKHDIMMLKKTIPQEHIITDKNEEIIPIHYVVATEQEQEQVLQPLVSETAQTMYDFPEPYCPGTSNPDLSDSISMWMTDDRTKPYQDFINVLSPLESINNIQSNSF